MTVDADPPARGSTSGPSGSPTAAFAAACAESIALWTKTLGIGAGHGDHAPKVAIDGDHAVVATNLGTVRFYALDAEKRRWTDAGHFPNLNRYSLTPAVAISGDVAVVRFVYQVLGLNQITGGGLTCMSGTRPRGRGGGRTC